jgi:ADP-ribosylglycohydrolase
MTPTTADRVTGCLKGIATGDAIGKQTEMLSRENVLQWYPDGIRGFEGIPNEIIPRYLGNSKHQWRVGETTDDTERTVAVARAIIDTRAVSHVSIGREMLRCTKCVHAGIASLWEFHQAGNPERIADCHDGCGAAVRVAPVGIVHTPASLGDLVNGAREASISTHGGALAIAAAAATAAAVSAAVDAASPVQVMQLAERAAAEAESRWPGRTAPSFAHALHKVRADLEALPHLRADDVARCCFPDRPLTIVPLALGLATLMDSAESAILLAANVGGDSDSVASIAGGVLGAMYPDTVNQQWFEVTERINGYDMTAIASALAALRH